MFDEENMKDILVFFVHGTWGGRNTNKILNFLLFREKEKTLWFDSNSEFAKNIISSDRCDCVSFDWVGSNCFNERDKAAKKLAGKIEEKFLKNKYDKLIIIGHSHGGNIALKSLDYIKKSVFYPSSSNSSIITMGTPFLFYKKNKFNKSHIYTWYSLVFSIFIFNFSERKNVKNKGIFNNFCGGSAVLFFIIPIFYRLLNYIFHRDKQTYDPKKAEFETVKTEKIPVYVIRTSHDEAAFFVNMNSYILLGLNTLFKTILKGDYKNNNIIPCIILTVTIIKVITDDMGIIKNIYMSPYELYNKYVICLILYWWLLYTLSYALMGMPLNGLKETDVSIQSTPDAEFNLSIDTITDENIMFSYRMRHAIYKNKKCIHIIKKILNEKFS